MKPYLRTYYQITHALEQSKRLSEGDKDRLKEHLKLLRHFLDIKNIKKAKSQTEKLSRLLLEILS